MCHASFGPHFGISVSPSFDFRWQKSAATNVSVRCLPVRLRWLEVKLFSRETDAVRKLESKTLTARLLRLELLFFRAPREGGLLPRVECLEAFVFGSQAGRAAATAECLKIVSTVDCIATRANAEMDDSMSDGEDKWFEDEKEESTGLYRIKRFAVIVTKDLKCRFGVVGNLSQGQEVEVLEVAVLKNEQLVRGRIMEPHAGWISLVSYETGFRWADRMIDNSKLSSTDEERMMQSDDNSTDSTKDTTRPDPTEDSEVERLPKRVRVEQHSHLLLPPPGYVEDLGFHKSPEAVHTEESCPEQMPVLSDRNGKQDASLGEVDPKSTFYKVLKYPKLGMNLQIGQVYTQADLEERGRCSMPPPLGQRELHAWVCRRDRFFEKLKNGAFCKVGAPDACAQRTATELFVSQPFGTKTQWPFV